MNEEKKNHPYGDDNFWPAFRLHRKERHQAWYEDNLRILQASGFSFKLSADGTVCLFREPGMPKVDFYPHTGRWRVTGVKAGDPKSRTFRGQAQAFLGWYGKQRRAEK